MSSLYIIVVAVVVVVAAHFAFIGYLVVGGFVALRWPRTIVLHILAVIWGPQHLAGPTVSGVLYPIDAVRVVEAGVFAVVIVSWGLFAYAMVRGRRRSSLRP